MSVLVIILTASLAQSETLFQCVVDSIENNKDVVDVECRMPLPDSTSKHMLVKGVMDKSKFEQGFRLNAPFPIHVSELRSTSREVVAGAIPRASTDGAKAKFDSDMIAPPKDDPITKGILKSIEDSSKGSLLLLTYTDRIVILRVKNGKVVTGSLPRFVLGKENIARARELGGQYKQHFRGFEKLFDQKQLQADVTAALKASSHQKNSSSSSERSSAGLERSRPEMCAQAANAYKNCTLDHPPGAIGN